MHGRMANATLAIGSQEALTGRPEIGSRIQEPEYDRVI